MASAIMFHSRVFHSRSVFHSICFVFHFFFLRKLASEADSYPPASERGPLDSIPLDGGEEWVEQIWVQNG